MISKEDILYFNKQFEQNPQHQATSYAVRENDLESTAKNGQVQSRHNYVFSDITSVGAVTSQKQSGRCWMFAALNAARVETMKKYNLETLEFSQTYTFFWDKLEKSNAFLEAILATTNEDIHSRLLSHLLLAPVQDGGQWDMFAGLLDKYGVVPKEAMPETFHSSKSASLERYLTSILRKYACELRQKAQEGFPDNQLQARKKEMLAHIYSLLIKTLGTPPKTIVFEYYDKDKNFHRSPELTPQEFFKQYVGWNLDDKISLINAPTADKPFYQNYTVKFLRSAVEAKPIRYLNLPIEELKTATIASIQNNEPVWFGCDVGKYLDRQTGIMDLDQYHYEKTLGECDSLSLTKAERLDYGESLLTHAMVLTGVNLDSEGKPITWKVENSWGEDLGKKGVFSMGDSWFNEFTYEVVVDRKYLSEKARAALSEPVRELEPWDPMGALAK